MTARCPDEDMAVAAVLESATAARRTTVADAVTARSADHDDVTAVAVAAAAADPVAGWAFASWHTGSPTGLAASWLLSQLHRPVTARSWWTSGQDGKGGKQLQQPHRGQERLLS